MLATNDDRFPACLKETLKWEGGYSNHPKDPGGATMKGVTQRVYNGWRDGHDLQRRSVRQIEEHELQDIYRSSYWAAVRGDELPAGVDLAVWDVAVNSGPVRAIKLLQKACGANIVDGHIGAATLAQVGRCEPAGLVARYMDEREHFLRSLPTFPTFGKGWINRCTAIEATALGMAGESLLLVAPPVPLPNPDAQSETQGRATAEDPKPPAGTEATLTVAGLMSNVEGVSNAFGKIGQGTKPLWAFLSEPLILTGIVMIASAVFTFLWRRKHA